MTSKRMKAFREHMNEVLDLRSAIAVLHWDMEVNMPPKAAPARGRQLATLSALEHRRFTAPEMGDLLAALQDQGDALTADEQILVAEAAYTYERAVKLPETFVQKLAEEESNAYQAWIKAREASDFSIFQPCLENLLELLGQKADYLGYEGSPYNALLEDHERGMTAETLNGIFGELTEKQSALIQRIQKAPQQWNHAWLNQRWDVDAQWAMTLQVLRDMGYDFEAGRQDRSVHPFTTNLDLYDVRITTRLNENELFSALTGSIHEGGHALYEQGFLSKDQGSLLAAAPSLGIHESQSRLWENMVGRSLAFWNYYTPLLQAIFPGQLEAISPEQIYRAINHVEPSFIRVEADECTYNLHVILRFEIEVALMEGAVTVADVPALWNEKVRDYLGLDAPNDAQGCLQDIHWSHGSLGYFPTYTLGNLYAAQLFEAIESEVPDIWSKIEAGDFAPLLGWLRDKVHHVGHRKMAAAIVEEATGKVPTAEPYLRYLTGKYSALYGLKEGA